MKQSRKKVVPKKSRGRPATGRDPVRQLRMSKDQAAAVTAWAKRQADNPNWSEAVRRLVEQSLTASQPPQKPSKKTTSKAHEMAGHEIDRLGDQSLPHEVREKRKRRLTKGPTEFREMRGDLPKPKG